MKVKFVLYQDGTWKVTVKIGPHVIEEFKNADEAKAIAKHLGVNLGHKDTVEVEIFV